MKSQRTVEAVGIADRLGVRRTKRDTSREREQSVFF
jgi:hypothetical protein